MAVASALPSAADEAPPGLPKARPIPGANGEVLDEIRAVPVRDLGTVATLVDRLAAVSGVGDVSVLALHGQTLRLAVRHDGQMVNAE